MGGERAERAGQRRLPVHVEHEAGRARVLRHMCLHCRGIHHDSPSGRGEEETFGALQRRLDVVPVVHVLGGLDGIEEPLVHKARPEGRDGSEEPPRAPRIAARHHARPRRQPVIEERRLQGLGGTREDGDIEERMPEAAVAPVEQHGRLDADPRVPGMGIAVHHRVGEAAGLDLFETSGQGRGKLLEHGTIGAPPENERTNRLDQRRSAPVWYAGRHESVESVRRGHLQLDQYVDDAALLGRRRLEAVTAGKLAQEQSSTLRRDHAR
jgi:hypothetical protein